MKKMRILGIMMAVMLISTAAFAQSGKVFDMEGVARAFETISTTTSSIGFTSTYLELTSYGSPVAALISVETAAIRFTLDGTTPTVTAGTGAGHLMNSGDSYVVRGFSNIQKFRCINAVASSGAAVKVTYFYGD